MVHPLCSLLSELCIHKIQAPSWSTMQILNFMHEAEDAALHEFISSLQADLHWLRQLHFDRISAGWAESEAKQEVPLSLKATKTMLR